MYAYKMQQNTKLIQKKKLLSPFFLVGIPFVTLILDVRINDPINVPKLIALIFISAWLLVDLVRSCVIEPIKKGSAEFTFFTIVILFLLTQLILIFSGNEIFTQVFGDTQRKNGFISYLSLGIIFLYALRYIRSNNVEKLVVTLMAASAVVIGYGLIQISGNDFLMWDNPYNTTITTLGNPNFTSAFLSLTFVLSLFSLLNKNLKIIFKLAAVPLMVLSIFVITKSESRQGFYAIAAGILLYLIVYINMNDIKFKKIYTALAIFLTGISLLGMLQIGPLANLLYKQSVSTRGYYWRAALKMLTDYPITGVGLDSYGEYFRRYKEIGYVRTYGVEITSNNAHNTFLQMFATGGFFTGTFYTIFVVGVLFYGLKSLKQIADVKIRKINLSLIATFVTYQAQSFISIDNLGLSVWSWGLAGAIIGLSFESRTENNRGINTSSSKGLEKNINFLLPVIRLFILTPVIFMSILLYRPESQMLVLRGLMDGNTQTNKSIAFEYAYKIIDNPLADPELKLRSSLFLGDFGYFEDTGRNLEHLLATNPTHFEYLWTMAYFQTQQGNLSQAINIRLRIAEIDPFNHSNYLELLKIYLKIDQKTRAIEIKNTILSIDPKSESAKTAGTLMELS